MRELRRDLMMTATVVSGKENWNDVASRLWRFASYWMLKLSERRQICWHAYTHEELFVEGCKEFPEF